MKSPNMMSTTGRIPVIAAPTPIPVIPASLIAWPKVRSRVAARPPSAGSALSIDIFGHLARVGVRRLERELQAGRDLGADALLDPLEFRGVRHALPDQPQAEQADRI